MCARKIERTEEVLSIELNNTATLEYIGITHGTLTCQAHMG